MKERMSWKDDERLYQPRVHSKRIRELHKIAEISGQPMTTVVDQAIAEFVERRKQQNTISPVSHMDDH